jgi:hypothetical protein
MDVLLQGVFERSGKQFARKTRQNSQSFAGVGVANSRREEAEGEGQHGDVQHEVLLCDVSLWGREKNILLALVA